MKDLELRTVKGSNGNYDMDANDNLISSIKNKLSLIENLN